MQIHRKVVLWTSSSIWNCWKYYRFQAVFCLFFPQGGSEAQPVQAEEVPPCASAVARRGLWAPCLHRGLQWGLAALSACCPAMPPTGRFKGQGHSRDGEGKEQSEITHVDAGFIFQTQWDPDYLSSFVWITSNQNVWVLFAPYGDLRED